MTRRIVVVGGGIAGLAAVHRLLEIRETRSLDVEVLLLEAAGRLGGAIATDHIDGFVVESGPDSIITEKPSALELCGRLGLQSHLVSTQAAYQRVHVVHRGKLRPLPEGFLLLAPTRLLPFLRTPLFSWRGKARIAAELFIRRAGDHDESLASFVRRRFGAELLERVAQPLIGGIYASDPEQLSLAATMPRFKEMEQTKGSLIKAMWSEQSRKRRVSQRGTGARWSLFVAPAGGMQELVDAIANRLDRSTIHLNTAVTGLARHRSGGGWVVSAGGNDDYDADAVLLATPAYATAALISPVAAEAAAELKRIPYASTATVNLAYRQADIPRALDSFGFVVPAAEKRPIMACTFSSLKYPGRAPAGHLLLRAFVGGTLQPQLLECDDATIEKNVRSELASLLGVTAEPLFSRTRRHLRSMPQYQVGHRDRVRRIAAALTLLPGLALAGNAYEGVGISDCVRTGEEAAERVLKSVRW